MIRLVLAALATSLAGGACAQSSEAPRTEAMAGRGHEEAVGRADCATAKYERRQRNVERQGMMTTDQNGGASGLGGSECSETEYSLYKQALDPARMMASDPTSAGYLRASPSRIQVVTELRRARQAGELDWAAQELGPPMMNARR